MRKSTLKKRSEKKVKEVLDNKKEQEMMHRFFMDIWNSMRPEQRVCYETGDKVHDPSTVNFHHVLYKERYPEYKFSKWNIVLVSWRAHDQTHTDDTKTPKIHALKESLLRKHKNGELKP
jgi:hypothetical protein